MKLCFPNFGGLGIVLETMCRQQGLEYVPLQTNLEEAMRIGVRLCPEGVCLPMKRMLGEFVLGAKQGADTALFLGGSGPCRFGYFAPLFQTILDEKHIPLRILALEAPAGSRTRFLRDLSRLIGVSEAKALRLLLRGWQALYLLDRWEETRLDAIAMLDPGENELQPPLPHSAPSFALLTHLLKTWRGDWKLKMLQQEREQEHFGLRPPGKTLQIGIVGDIYTTIDPFINQHLQERLARMGVVTRRSLRLSDHLLHLVVGGGAQLRAAKGYLGRNIGGFAQETIGGSEQMRRAGFDGLIQVYPLSCMPEIVADGILGGLQADHGIPLLRLILDEHSGAAGLQTRLEAFVDMLKRRRMAG